MVNKLRQTANAIGTFLLVVAIWGAVEYGPVARVTTFVGVGLLGVVVAVTPVAIARGRRHYGWLRTEVGGGSRTGGSYYVSTGRVGGHERTLRAVRDAVIDVSDFDGASIDEFPEGPGLSVVHSGFHNSFVRISPDDRVVISGASERTSAVADLLRDRLGVDFDRRRSNPLRNERPVEGGLRVVLATVFVLAAVGGVLAVAGAGYPSTAYNPVEKAVLASYDARVTVSPSMTRTDAAIAKAEFRITTLQEADTEIRWAGNHSKRVLVHGYGAATTAATVRATLADLRDESLTAAQRARVADARTDLRAAESAVAEALVARADDAAISRRGATEIRELATGFRNHHPGRVVRSRSLSNSTSDASASGSGLDGPTDGWPGGHGHVPSSYSNSVHDPSM